MKKAEEWIKYLDPNTSSKSCCYSPVHIEDIKQIQLDAIKEGMTIVVFLYCDNSRFFVHKILTDCDNLKEL